jgi:DNA-binding transcriptional LysR family regulator
MEWDDLKYFLAVARLGTLTKAGQTLRTTPATVARRIAQLESALGTRLFDKKYTGYLLTEGGRTLLAKAEEVEDSILSMEREALGRDARSSGKVRLTTTEDIATMVLAPRFDEFVRRFPEIQLEISSTREVLSLARGQADIAMRTVRPARGRLVIRQAGWWELGLYASPMSTATISDLLCPISRKSISSLGPRNLRTFVAVLGLVSTPATVKSLWRRVRDEFILRLARLAWGWRSCRVCWRPMIRT